MIKNTIIAALAIVAMVGCQKNSDVDQVDDASVVVNFESKAVSTRTSQVEQDGEIVYLWDSEDKIGISGMGRTNVPYETDITESSESTGFTCLAYDPIEIYYMEDGDYTFTAYYPYSETGNFFIDLASQKDNLENVVDPLIASSTEEYYSYDQINPTVDFEFQHLLAKVVLNIEFNDDVQDISSLSAIINNVQTERTYSVTESGLAIVLSDQCSSIDLTTSIDTESRIAVVTGLFLPQSLFSDSDINNDMTTIKFNVAGDIYKLSFYEDLESGKQYNYTVYISENDIDYE